MYNLELSIAEFYESPKRTQRITKKIAFCCIFAQQMKNFVKKTNIS